jgi:hypothetical protein
MWSALTLAILGAFLFVFSLFRPNETDADQLAALVCAIAGMLLMIVGGLGFVALFFIGPTPLR